MRGVLISVLVAVSSLAGLPFHSAAWADEAYVCEGGRVAYVKFGQLDAMKRKDPCIAAYYGGVPAEAAAASEDADAAVVDDPAGDGASDALPIVRTTGSRPAAVARTNAAAVLKEPLRLPVQPVAPPRKLAASTAAPRAAVPLPVAHPDTDFRNVRILNAGPGEAAIYRHAR